MDWKDAVIRIREADDNNRLVIFVGAGVSKNSNIPTWSELIDQIAGKIDYQKECAAENGDYTQKEYLRIPEYYFNQDREGYYGLLRDLVHAEAKPNPIDNEILNILPHHIITTNYDTLLETARSVNTQMYSVVTADSDILSKPNDHYIIKMHGDLSDIEHIVLKETDYYTYEQDHPLISTFIRSLLINHTFLFVGYGLNDVNLDIILGWINYYTDLHKVADRPKSFIVQSRTRSQLEKERLEKKNLYVVDLSTLPEDILEMTPCDALDTGRAKRMFAFLRCISDAGLLKSLVSFESFLDSRYNLLKSYSYISHSDLIHTFDFGQVEWKGRSLFFMEERDYRAVADAVKAGNPQILELLKKADARAVGMAFEDQELVTLEGCPENPLFRLYLDNEYAKLLTAIQGEDITTRLYYSSILGEDPGRIRQLASEEEDYLEEPDVVELMLHKMRKYVIHVEQFDKNGHQIGELNYLFDTMPRKYRNSTIFLSQLRFYHHQSLPKMRGLLHDLEQYYLNGKRSAGRGVYYLEKIRAYAYDYYTFIRRNLLPMDNVRNPRLFFSVYTQAVFCTYYPYELLDGRRETDLQTAKEACRLNETDLDIIVKFILPKDLRQWASEYHVHDIRWDWDVDVRGKYCSLCASFEELQRYFIAGQIHTFTILLANSVYDRALYREAFLALTGAFTSVLHRSLTRGSWLFESVCVLSMVIDPYDNEEACFRLLCEIAKADVFQLLDRKYHRFLLDLLEKLDIAFPESMQEKLASLIDASEEEVKLRQICMMRRMLPMGRYGDFLRKKRESVDSELLVALIRDKYMTFDERIESILVDRVEEAYQARLNCREDKAAAAHVAFIRHMECLILLKLNGEDVNITKLIRYAKYSPYIKFMIAPDTYDYSEIDLSDYLWQNFFRSPQYRGHFLKHKSEILNQRMKKLFTNNCETREQQKIVYGMLLNDEELWDY